MCGEIFIFYVAKDSKSSIVILLGHYTYQIDRNLEKKKKNPKFGNAQ